MRKNKIIRVFTLFSGYESQLMALMLLSMEHPEYKFVLVGWCEIDKAAIRSHNSVFPEYAHVHYKDVTKIDWNTVPDFDLLFYSSCCQSLSLTGAMEGMEKGSGTQSSLIWYVLDAIKVKKPRYCILENVKNIVSKTFMPSFIDWMRAVDAEGYHSAAKILNSSDFGIPQNRERLFMVSIRDDINQVYQFPKPVKKCKSIKRLLEKHVNEKYYKPNQEAVKFVLALSGKSIDEDQIAHIEEPTLGRRVDMISPMASLTCNSRTGIHVIPTLKATGYGVGTYKNFSTTGYYPQVAILEVWEGDAPIGFSYQSLIDGAENSCKDVTNASCDDIIEVVKNLRPTQYLRLRMMTPREQFRFMGVPKEYIEKLLKSGNDDKELYKQAGNSIVVNVLYHLFTSLFIINCNKSNYEETRVKEC